jgi:hypothetical protein
MAAILILCMATSGFMGSSVLGLGPIVSLPAKTYFIPSLPLLFVHSKILAISASTEYSAMLNIGCRQIGQGFPTFSHRNQSAMYKIPH